MHMARKISRRHLLQLSGLGLGAATLVACAATPAPSAPAAEKTVEEEATAAPPAAEAVKLTTMWRTNPAENTMLEGIVELWAKEHPDIEVEPIFVPWDEYEPKLLAMYAGGVAPDVTGIGGTNPYVERYVRGMVMGLRPFLDVNPEIEEGMWPVAIKAYSIRGDVIGLPWSITYPGFFYNATLLDETGVEHPPVDWTDESWTFEEVMVRAKQLTLDKDNDGRTDQFGVEFSHRSPFYLTRLWGQDLVTDEDYADGVLHKLRFDEDEVYEACLAGIQFVANAIHKEKVTPSPDTAQALSQLGPMLKTGALAMNFSAAWALSPPLPEQYEFGAAAEPRAKTTGHTAWLNPMQMISTTKHPDEAWKFMAFFVTNAKAQEIFLENTTGKIPPAKAGLKAYVDGWAPRLVNTPDELELMIQGALDQVKSSCPCHILVGWAAIRDTFNSELEPVWLGTTEPKEALDTMIPLMNEALEDKLKELELAFAIPHFVAVTEYDIEKARAGTGCGCGGCGGGCSGCSSAAACTAKV